MNEFLKQWLNVLFITIEFYYFTLTDGYMSSPERGTRAYEEPYYTQYGTRGGSVTAIIDEEQK